MVLGEGQDGGERPWLIPAPTAATAVHPDLRERAAGLQERGG